MDKLFPTEPNPRTEAWDHPGAAWDVAEPENNYNEIAEFIGERAAAGMMADSFEDTNKFSAGEAISVGKPVATYGAALLLKALREMDVLTEPIDEEQMRATIRKIQEGEN